MPFAADVYINKQTLSYHFRSSRHKDVATRALRGICEKNFCDGVLA